MTRKVTTQLYAMVEDGTLDRDTLIRECLSYMSEADVADMAQASGLVEDGKPEEDE